MYGCVSVRLLPEGLVRSFFSLALEFSGLKRPLGWHLRKAYKGKYTSSSCLRQRIADGQTADRLKSLGRGLIKDINEEIRLWKSCTYTREYRRPHICPGLDVCSEKIGEGPKFHLWLILRLCSSRKWMLRQSCKWQKHWSTAQTHSHLQRLGEYFIMLVRHLRKSLSVKSLANH